MPRSAPTCRSAVAGEWFWHDARVTDDEGGRADGSPHRRLVSAAAGKDHGVKKYILFDHDGVLVDTEFWYYKAGERALADIGLTLDRDQYLWDMNQGLGTWAQARAAGIDEETISRQREVRNDYYQEYLRTEPIEIDGVVEVLAELAQYVRMAIVTTAKRVDFEIIHEKRHVRKFMDFVLVREDYNLAKPHPEPYLTGLKRFGATEEETLVVEDSSRGLNSAVAAGIDCAIVYNDFTRTGDFSRATYRIETLIELKDIIRN
jgi:HAD superfamily hydrolase (TIGR01509 family)